MLHLTCSCPHPHLKFCCVVILPWLVKTYKSSEEDELIWSREKAKCPGCMPRYIAQNSSNVCGKWTLKVIIIAKMGCASPSFWKSSQKTIWKSNTEVEGMQQPTYTTNMLHHIFLIVWNIPCIHNYKVSFRLAQETLKEIQDIHNIIDKPKTLLTTRRDMRKSHGI